MYCTVFAFIPICFSLPLSMSQLSFCFFLLLCLYLCLCIFYLLLYHCAFVSISCSVSLSYSTSFFYLFYVSALYYFLLHNLYPLLLQIRMNLCCCVVLFDWLEIPTWGDRESEYDKACEGMVWFGRKPVGFPPQGAESSNHKTIAAVPPSSSSSWQPSSNTQKCWNILQIYFSCIFCKYYASLFCQSILLVFCHNLFPRSYILYKFIYKPRPKTYVVPEDLSKSIPKHT